jgi:hypothetical protein
LPPSLAALLFGLALILVPIRMFPICEYAGAPAPAEAAMGHASAAGHAPAGGPAAEAALGVAVAPLASLRAVRRLTRVDVAANLRSDA